MVLSNHIYISLFVIISAPLAVVISTEGDGEPKKAMTNTMPGDTETELLDKEYGVRYADQCEGKLTSHV